jgi:hypothetical protein
VLLLLTFRSIVIPIKAIVLNLLSVGAAYGVLVLIFQRGNLERRAAAAALCEPVLLTEAARVRTVLAVLEQATAGVTSAGPDQRRSDEFKALRKGLGYCWSLAVVAAPKVGRLAFEALVAHAAQSGDRDLRWIARENLCKRRLERLDADWVATLRARLE